MAWNRRSRWRGARTAGQDTLAAYILLATSCDKTLATTACFTSIRVVCQNTLAFAAKDVASNKRPQVKVNHTLHFDAKDVKRRLGLASAAWESFIGAVKKMSTHELQESQARAFFESLLRQKPHLPLSPRAQNEHATIAALYATAPGQSLPTAKGTLWGAVNAVTYYVDHVKGKSGERLNNAWFGSGSALKDRAWAVAQELITS